MAWKWEKKLSPFTHNKGKNSWKIIKEKVTVSKCSLCVVPKQSLETRNHEKIIHSWENNQLLETNYRLVETLKLPDMYIVIAITINFTCLKGFLGSNYKDKNKS